MLPFLKLDKEGSASMPTDKLERKADNPEELDLLEGCLEELMAAFKAGDKKAAARALKDAFEVCDSMPHEEGPHYG